MSIRTKNLLLIIIIFALILPQFAFAFISPWDYVSTALGGIEEKVKHIFGGVVRIFFLYAIGLILLVTSAALLDWVVAQPQWLTLKGSQLVRAGFAFTAGIANIFLILIFIIIAFAYILKLETFQAKKSLPKLIMVALLINFSLVFIGMLIDISNIFYNTILGGNKDLANSIVRNLVGGMRGVLQIMLGWFIAFAASALIPLIHSLPYQVGALMTAGAVLLPNMVTWAFQLILSYLMAGIFFLYVFLFAARVFIVQILAIFSPLAFLCLILPQTEKHWKEWLQHLVQWVSLGIFLLFFLIIGLKASTLLMPPGGPQPLPLLAWFTGIDKYFIYYFFLFIYMILALWVSKRTMPTLASFIIEQATTWGTRLWTGVGKPLGSRIQRQLKETAAEEAKRRGEIEAKMKRGEKLTRGEKLALWSEKFARPVRWGYRYIARTTPEVEVAKDVEKQAKELEETFGKDVKSAVEFHKSVFLPTGDRLTRAALALYLQKVKGAKGLGELEENQLYKAIEATSRFVPHRVEDIVKHKPELIDETTARKRAEEEARKKGITKPEEIEKLVKEKEEIARVIQKTMVSKGLEDDDAKKLMEIGISQTDAVRKAAFKKAVDAMKTADIENLATTTIENKDFQEMVVRFKDVNFIRRIGEEKGAEYITKLRAKAEELGAEEIAKTNLTLLRSAITNPGFRAVFPPIRGAGRMEEVEVLSRLIREPVLLEYDRAKRKAEELRRKRRPDTALEKEVEEAREKIEATPKLKEIWDEIEKLREKPPTTKGK